MREEVVNRGRYYYVIDGTFRTRVDEDAPGAIRRDWKSADGKTSGTKYERHLKAIFGRISDIQFNDGDYGININIHLEQGEDEEMPGIITLGAASREGEDFLKKIPTADLNKEIRFRPFAFIGDSQEEVRGLEMTQQGETEQFDVKMTNHFRDTEKKVNINGLPNPEKENDKMDKDDWKIYFLQVRKFLINYTKEHVLPKFQQGAAQATPTDAVEALGNAVAPKTVLDEKKDEINPDDIPF